MKKLGLIILVLFYASKSIGQTVTIKGRINDAVSKEGLPSCNVFINNTTIGQNTNLDGFYQISNLKQREFEIVFRYVGYITSTRKIVAKEGETITLDIELKPALNVLTEVEVKSKRDKKWEKQLKQFKNSFWGYSEFAKKCELENAWILDFNEEDDVFTASSDQTLKVINNALGYTIGIDLLEYKIEKDRYKILFRSQFTEMNPPNKDKLEEWIRNRKIAYTKSSSYFFRTMASNQLKENGYALYLPKPGSNPIRTDVFLNELNKTVINYEPGNLVSLGKRPGQKKLSIVNNLEIHNQNTNSEVKVYQDADFGISWMEVRGNNVYLDEAGVILNPQDVEVSGDMGYLKMSGLLPVNFDEKVDINEAYFLNFEKPAFAETVHLHTDRSGYYKNEKIWFKAYLNYSSFSPIDTTSKTLYVQLYDRNAQSVSHQKVEISNGYAYGQMPLDSSLKVGDYALTAYTNYMKNFTKKSFVKNIKILAPNQAVEAANEDNIIDNKILVDILHDQKTLTIKTSDKENKPVAVNASIAIGNPNHMHGSSSMIQTDLALPKQKIKLPFAYPMDKGLEIRGTVFDKKKLPIKAEFTVFGIGLNNIFEGSSDLNGNFALNEMSYFGDAELIFKMKSKKMKDNTIIVKNIPEPKNSNFEFLSQKVQNFENPIIEFEPEKDTLAKAKAEEEEPIKNIYGRPQYRLLEKDINKTNGIQGVINSITSRVPSIRYTSAGFVIRGGNVSSSQSKEALMLIDGTPNDNFNSLDPNNIRKIEIVSGLAPMYGDQGRNGIVSIFLKSEMSKDPADDAKKIKLNLKGYEIAEVFEKSKFKMIDKDQNLPTVYWNPEILTNEKGECVLEIPNLKRPFKVVIEGVSQSNIPFRKDQTIN